MPDLTYDEADRCPECDGVLRFGHECKTPLERNIEELDAAYTDFKAALVNCQDGSANRADVRRYTLALFALIEEAKDLMPYSENS